jgi:hypothetical protein
LRRRDGVGDEGEGVLPRFTPGVFILWWLGGATLKNGRIPFQRSEEGSIKRFVIGTALFITVACGSPTTLIEGRLAVQATPPVLQLTNQSPAPVYSFATERGAAAKSNWAACTDPARCAGLAPGTTTALPYTQIASYTPAAREAIVYWWHLIPATGMGFRPDSIRAVVVTL